MSQVVPVRPLRRILSQQAALVAVVPFLLAASLAAAWFYRQIRSDVEQRQQQLAIAVSAQISGHLASALVAVKSAGALSFDRELSWHVLERVLDGQVRSSDSLRLLYAVGTDGRVAAVGLPAGKEGRRQDIAGLDLSRNAFFREVVERRAAAWSETFLSVIGGGLSVAIGVPGRGAVIVGEVDLSRLTGFLRELARGRDQLILVIDGRGQVIADHEGRHTAQQLNVRNLDVVRRGMETPLGVSDEFDFEGRPMVGSLVDVPSMEWHVLVAQPTEVAFRPLHTVSRIAAAGLAGALVAGLAGALLMSRKLSRRFEALAAHARKVAQGEDADRWPRSTITEFEQLAENLQEMAAAARERERQLATLMSNLPGMVYRCAPDPGWPFLFVSEGCRAITGRGPGELSGLARLPDAQDGPAVEQRVRDALSGRRPYEVVYRISSGEGQPKWVSDHGQGVFDSGGTLVALEGIVTDISQRRRAEDEALQLAAAVEQAADEILITDAEGNIRYVNSAVERTSGYPRNEVLGRNPRLFASGRHDASFYAEMWAKLSSGEAWQGRLTNRTRDGREILLDSRISPLRDSDGRVVGYVAARRDVTEQVNLERHLSQTARLEAIGTLAGGIAHDFNNILSAIVGYTELALLDNPECSNLKQDLQPVLQASERAAGLVRQILAFSRAPEKEAGPVVAAPVFKEALKLLRAAIPATIDVEQQILSDGAVLADPGELHRILVNLCTNAVLAMPTQQGTIEVRLEDVDLDAAFAANRPGFAPGKYLRLTVRDTGVGMTPEVKARIFDPFFTTRGDAGGTGLGLSVVHGIVRNRQGTISVTSEPGRGTTFEVFLPRIAQLGKVDRGNGGALVRGTERILFVDDEPMVARLAEGTLGNLGYRVRAFTSPMEAVRAFEQAPHDFDVVVTDMTMPQMSGDVLASRIRALRPEIPVVLCTGFSSRITAEGARSAGIQEFLTKPISLGELTQAIGRALGKG